MIETGGWPGPSRPRFAELASGWQILPSVTHHKDFPGAAREERRHPAQRPMEDRSKPLPRDSKERALHPLDGRYGMPEEALTAANTRAAAETGISAKVQG